MTAPSFEAWETHRYLKNRLDIVRARGVGLLDYTYAPRHPPSVPTMEDRQVGHLTSYCHQMSNCGLCILPTRFASVITGGLTNPRPWRGRCRAGYSNTGGPPLPRKRAPLQKKKDLRPIVFGTWEINFENSTTGIYKKMSVNGDQTLIICLKMM